MKAILKAMAWEHFGTKIGGQTLSVVCMVFAVTACLLAIPAIYGGSEHTFEVKMFRELSLSIMLFFICSLSAITMWVCLGDDSRYYLKPVSNRFLTLSHYLGGATLLVIEVGATIILWNWLFFQNPCSVAHGLACSLGLFGVFFTFGNPNKPTPTLMLKLILAVMVFVGWIAMRTLPMRSLDPQEDLGLMPQEMIQRDQVIGLVLFVAGGFIGYWNLQSERCGREPFRDERVKKWLSSLIEWIPTFQLRTTTTSKANFWFEWTSRWRVYFPFLFFGLLGILQFGIAGFIINGSTSNFWRRNLDFPSAMLGLNGFLLGLLGIFLPFLRPAHDALSENAGSNAWLEHANLGPFRSALPVPDQAFGIAILKSILAIVGTALLTFMFLQGSFLAILYWQGGVPKPGDSVWVFFIVLALGNWIAMANGTVIAYTKGGVLWFLVACVFLGGISSILSHVRSDLIPWFQLVALSTGLGITLWKYQQATRMGLLSPKAALGILTIAIAIVLLGGAIDPSKGSFVLLREAPIRFAIFGFFAIGIIFPIAALPVAIRKGRVT